VSSSPQIATGAGAALAAPLSPSARQKRMTLLACILGSATVFLDATLVNVALPAIRADLRGGLATQEWVIDAYLLTLGSLLLVGGSLGDLFGRRKIFAIGVAAFGVASLLCAVAPTAAALIAARAVQGVAGALLTPSTLALITDTFHEHERAAAIGTWTAWSGIATALGPLLGGLLVQAGSWRWIFVVNVPFILATLWLLRFVPPSTPTAGAHVDWRGGALCALGLGGPTFALIEQPSYGWSAPRVWVPLVAGIALLAAFVAWERRCRAPMLPLSMFRARNFAVGNLATLVFYGGLGAATFFLVVFLQEVAGYSPLAAGVALMPISILVFLLARRFGALADRLGPRLFMGFGPIVASAGLLLLVGVGAHANYATDVLPGVTLLALGLAITIAPLTAAVLGAVEGNHSGVAAGVNNAVARVAGLVAIAAVGAAVAGQFASSLDAAFARPAGSAALHAAVVRAQSRTLVVDAGGFPPAARAHAHAALISASVDGYRLAMAIAAALALASGLISLAGISNGRRSVPAADCPGGPLCGASVDVAERRAPVTA
jgi:EmrB/QacA subfamily drug resistance transporter